MKIIDKIERKIKKAGYTPLDHWWLFPTNKYFVNDFVKFGECHFRVIDEDGRYAFINYELGYDKFFVTNIGSRNYYNKPVPDYNGFFNPDDLVYWDACDEFEPDEERDIKAEELYKEFKKDEYYPFKLDYNIQSWYRRGYKSLECFWYDARVKDPTIYC